MTWPQIADGDGLHILRVAEKILNQLSWTAPKKWSCSLGVGRGI